LVLDDLSGWGYGITAAGQSVVLIPARTSQWFGVEIMGLGLSPIAVHHSESSDPGPQAHFV
jgi:hypothetical protein